MCSRADDPTMHDAPTAAFMAHHAAIGCDLTHAHSIAECRTPGVSRCWQNNGWHVYMAGPCFDTRDQAVAYRDALDARNLTWWPQDEALPPIRR